jgi:hypothetical protein
VYGFNAKVDTVTNFNINKNKLRTLAISMSITNTLPVFMSKGSKSFNYIHLGTRRKSEGYQTISVSNMSSQNLFCSSHDKADNLSHVVKKITLFLFTAGVIKKEQFRETGNNNCDNSFNVTLPYLIVSMLFHNYPCGK